MPFEQDAALTQSAGEGVSCPKNGVKPTERVEGKRGSNTGGAGVSSPKAGDMSGAEGDAQRVAGSSPEGAAAEATERQEKADVRTTSPTAGTPAPKQQGSGKAAAQQRSKQRDESEDHASPKQSAAATPEKCEDPAKTSEGSQDTAAQGGSSPAAAAIGEKAKKKKRGHGGRAAALTVEAGGDSPSSLSGSNAPGSGGKNASPNPASPGQAAHAARSGGTRGAGNAVGGAYFGKVRGGAHPASAGALNVPPPPPLPLAYDVNMHAVPQMAYQPMPPPSPVAVTPPEASKLTPALEALFSQENLLRDRFLATNITPGDLLLDLSVLLAHPTVAAWNFSADDLEAALRRSQLLSLTERSVEVSKAEESAAKAEEDAEKAKEKEDGVEKKDEAKETKGEDGAAAPAEEKAETKRTVKFISLANLLAETRNTLALRDMPESLSEDTLRSLVEGAPIFVKEEEDKKEHEMKDSEEGKDSGGKQTTSGPIRSIRREVNNTWFVTVQDENTAQELALWLRTQQIEGRPIRVGIKATHSLQRIVSSSQQYPSAQAGGVASAGFAYRGSYGDRAGAAHYMHPLAAYPAPTRDPAGAAGPHARYLPPFAAPFAAAATPYPVSLAASYGRPHALPAAAGSYAPAGGSRSPAVRPAFVAPGQQGGRGERAGSGKAGGKAAASSSSSGGGGGGAAAAAGPRTAGGRSPARPANFAGGAAAYRGPAQYLPPAAWIPYDLSWGSYAAPVPPPSWQATVAPGSSPAAAAASQSPAAGASSSTKQGAGEASPSGNTASSVTGETAPSSRPSPASPPSPSAKGEVDAGNAGESEQKGDGAASSAPAAGRESGAAASKESQASASSDTRASTPAGQGPTSGFGVLQSAGAPLAAGVPTAWAPAAPYYYDPALYSSLNGGFIPTYPTAYGCWAAPGGPVTTTTTLPPSAGSDGLNGAVASAGQADAVFAQSGVAAGKGSGAAAGRGSRGGGGVSGGGGPGTPSAAAGGKQAAARWCAQQQPQKSPPSPTNSGGWKVVGSSRRKKGGAKDGEWTASGAAASEQTSVNGRGAASAATPAGAAAAAGSSRKARGILSVLQSSPPLSGEPFLEGGDFPSLSVAMNARPAKPCGYKKAFRNFTASEVVDICNTYEAAHPNGVDVPHDIRDLRDSGCALALETPRQGAACWAAFAARQRQKDLPSPALRPIASEGAEGSVKGEEAHASADGKLAREHSAKSPSSEKAPEPAAAEKNGVDNASGALSQGKEKKEADAGHSPKNVSTSADSALRVDAVA
ncbi:hypothetical protein BESB_015070 [Besnoitia besnoiti]|uniref:HTH La-type RNA-binding domain-containing protein n=1 Tax=Besnoitia besnoiti TaxID=94643 RepID=A0A2A9M6T2_BESBE|nr:hypothetical protein BESB_015070 [Besnoitia besnoiti]PFH32894.1 hypothetical protein BESB_015070 [Besnoitia besnoiti]